MNESVKKDLQNICSVQEFDVLMKMIQVIETTPDRKQKDALKKIIDEEIQ